jgi:acetyltransferase-like isoleucine patch superfamily enzyme
MSPQDQQRVAASTLLRRKLANNRGRPPAEVAARAAAFVAATVVSRYHLRKATSTGWGGRVIGHAPLIHNEGTLTLGNEVKLEAPVRPIFFHVLPGGRLILGDQVAVNDGVRIECTSLIRIGNRVRIGFGAAIIDNHFHDLYDRATRPVGDPVVLADDVWIAANALVLPGVTVGEGSVVAAASVVSRDVPPFTVVAGNPARVIRSLDAWRFTRPDPTTPGRPDHDR